VRQFLSNTGKSSQISRTDDLPLPGYEYNDKYGRSVYDVFLHYLLSKLMLDYPPMDILISGLLRVIFLNLVLFPGYAA